MQDLLSISSFWHGTSQLEKAPVALVSVCSAEGPSSSDASASRYSTLKYVGILSVVEAIRELVQIEREVLPADIMIRTDDASLEQAPERIKIISVDVSMHVFASGMAYFLVTEAELAELIVARMFVRGDQVHLVAYSLADKLIQGFPISGFDYSADHIALAGNRSYNSDLRAATSGMLLFVPMAILILAADISFIYFNDAHELLKVGVCHSGAKSMAHIPSGLMGSPDLSRDLQSTDTFLTVEHLPEHFKPSFDVNVRILKDRAHGNGETVGRPLCGSASFANPVPRAGFELIYFLALAARALDAVRPAALHDEFLASIIIRERFHQLFKGHHDGEKVA